MPKVSVVSPERAKVANAVGRFGEGATSAYFEGEKYPLHLYLHQLGEGQRLRIGLLETDCLGYVWRGTAHAEGNVMPQGSSLVVEHGQSLDVEAGAGGATVLTFSSAHPIPDQGDGGHVHLLPADRVPRSGDLGGGSGVAGGMHFDSACPSCTVWLHENHFPPSGPLTEEQMQRGVHSHSEDEIIFVTAGAVRLGPKLFGPGTAVQIAADTLYSLSAGPEGLSFINFRPGMPGDIRFANGMTISETGYWRERLPRPEYLAVA